MRVKKTFTYNCIKGFRYGYSPIGKPFLYVNVYYVDGLLIDTGQSHMRQSVLQDIRKLNINQIFITHCHEDHTGNLNAISQVVQCPIYTSKACADLLKNPPKISLAQALFWGNRRSFYKTSIKENSITTPKYTFRIIPIPGHAADMVALYEENQGWLFSSDLFINPYISYFIDTEDIGEQIRSIKRVLELDFDVLLCAHNPQFTNGKQKLQEKLEFLETFYAKVAAIYKKGMSAKQVFQQLQLKEKIGIKVLSGGKLSKINMVKSVINDLNKKA